MRLLAGPALVALIALSGCGDDDDWKNPPLPANQVVRARIAEYQPSANFGHRGAGLNQSGNAFPENSLAAFEHGLAEGADGAELDVVLTADRKLVVMHDETLDRTTTCTGCVSTMTLAQVRECLLRDGNGNVSDQHPPTLDEVYATIPADVLVSVELKLADPPCRITDEPATIAAIGVAELHRLKVADRTIVCSFDADALAAVKALDPEIYAAFLFNGLRQRHIDQALQLGLDAIEPGGVFPFVMVAPELVQAALSTGLQVHVWTVDDEPSMNAMISAGASSIITNFPDKLAQVIDMRQAE